jgi:alkylhydroperoxidase family enzyme
VLQGCRYCIHAHTAVAFEVGLRVEEVRALRGETPVEAGFADEGERAMICWIDAMAGATGPVPDDVWTAVRGHVAEHVLVELAVTIGATMLLNRFATGFELPTPAETVASFDSAGPP